MPEQKIIPQLWLDKNADEAAEFYAKVFPDSRVKLKSKFKALSQDFVEFQIMKFNFSALSPGICFSINPSISFFVNFDPSRDKNAGRNIDAVWEKLSRGGKVLMPIEEYPWSKRYGWLQDKYGVSWQLILTDPKEEDRPEIIPSLLFTGKMDGKAEEAAKFYVSVFKNSKMGKIARHGPSQEPGKEGKVIFSDFKIEGTWIVAMDSAGVKHEFEFNEAVSLVINCKDQKEIDYYWENLSTDPELDQCGWATDKFGISWKILPENMDEIISRNPEKADLAIMTMKKIVIKELENAVK